jgi:riboflavin biosynthesis pyrimidine reductase
MGLVAEPTVVLVTGSGELSLGRNGWTDQGPPIVVATTKTGAARMRSGRVPRDVSIRAITEGSRVDPNDVSALCQSLGARVVLTEGGPHLLGGLVAEDLVDELFLTLAPQLVGRAWEGRLGLVEGVGMDAASARWHELVSVKRSTDHLFLRYRRRSGRRPTEELLNV